MRFSKPAGLSATAVTATAVTAIVGVTAAVVIGVSSSDHAAPTADAGSAARASSASSEPTAESGPASATAASTTPTASTSPSAAATASPGADGAAARGGSVPPRTPLATTQKANQAPAIAAQPAPALTRRAIAPAPQPPAPKPPPLNRPGGRPGPTNTGVPAGTPLTVVNGDVVVTTPGTVIDAKHIKGALIIKASNVKVTRSLIEGRAGSDSVVISSGSGILLQDDEVAVAHPSPSTDAMSVRGATLNRLNIHGGVDGMKLSSNSVVQNSWIHGLTYFSSDPAQGGGPTHNDAIQIMSGANIRITGNYLQAASSNNAAIQVTQDTGSTSGLYISGNWADGGGCTYNFSGHGPNGELLAMGGITVTNNRFGRNTGFDGCAILVDLQTTISLSGNVFDDTGQPIVVQRHN
ncbi:MAG TPA: hypothetical protein VF218_15315 [Acidothermaceae bacterium]